MSGMGIGPKREGIKANVYHRYSVRSSQWQGKFISFGINSKDTMSGI